MKSSLENRTIFTRDNLEVMRGMADECIDLIYLDPPFNSNHNYAAPIGSQAAGAEFKDTWTLDEIDLAWHGEIAEAHPGLYKLLEATREIHGASMMAYLIYIAMRAIEMRRILKPAGSIYLHCDPTASHYLKLLMDEVFGKGIFRNEITWKRQSAHSDGQAFGKVTDVLLFYGHGINKNAVRIPLTKEQVEKYVYSDSLGRYVADNISAKGLTGGGYEYDFHGHNGPWRYPEHRLLELEKKGRIHIPSKPGGVPRLKRYLHEHKGIVPGSIWTDVPPVQSHSRQRTGYPTQKPLALLERIIKASSNPGDMVLDPFCGCATTCVAAEKLDRQWIGIDVSSLAARLVQVRIERELGVLLFDPIHRTDIPLDRGGERSKNIKHILYGAQEGTCNGCQIHFPYVNLTVDHIVPKSKGGADVDENLQLLCARCNSVKGNRTQEYLISQVRMTA